MEFVINEWYLDWHRPDAAPSEQAAARKFLEWLQASQHRVVVLRDSPFIQKLHTYRRDFNYHPMCKIFLKQFFTILENADRCRILEEPPTLPPEIEELLRRPLENPLSNYESDRYLFESSETTDAKIIITTDVKLVKHFEGNGRFQLWSVDEFWAKFAT